jgi:acyl carrier protein
MTKEINMTDDVSIRVAQIIAEQAMLDPEAIKPETTLDDLGLDSLALVEVVFGIEEAFDISVPFNANEPKASEFDISKVSQIIAGVKSLIAAKD